MRRLLAAASVLLLSACSSNTAASQTEVWVGLARPGHAVAAALLAPATPYTQGGPSAAVSVNGSAAVGSVMIKAWREGSGARVQVYSAESQTPDNTSAVSMIGSYHLAVGEKRPVAELSQLGVEPVTLVCQSSNPTGQ